MTWSKVILVSSGLLGVSSALKDGVGVKPHMGWSSWVSPSHNATIGQLPTYLFS